MPPSRLHQVHGWGIRIAQEDRLTRCQRVRGIGLAVGKPVGHRQIPIAFTKSHGAGGRCGGGRIGREPVPESVGQSAAERLAFLDQRLRLRLPRCGIVQGPDRVAGAGEYAIQCVVILRGNCVELVVVTTGAGNGEAEERFGEDVDLVVNELELMMADVNGRMHLLAEPVLGRAQERFIAAVGRVGSGVWQQITRDLFARELIKGQVRVEGAHQVIPVLPGAQHRIIELVPQRLGVTHFVEPMPRPTLTKVRRLEQPIDHAAEGCVRTIAFKGCHFGRSGGKSREQIIGASYQNAFCRPGCRPQTGRFEFRQDETVHRACRPVIRGDARRFGRADRLPGPVRLASRGQVESLSIRALPHRGRFFRPGGAVCDPLSEVRHHRVVQAALGRHLQIRVSVGDRLEQQTPVGCTGFKRGTGIAPLQQTLAMVEQQSAAHPFGFRGVTAVALIHQDRTDALLKKRNLRRIRFRGNRPDESRREHDDRPEHDDAMKPQMKPSCKGRL